MSDANPADPDKGDAADKLKVGLSTLTPAEKKDFQDSLRWLRSSSDEKLAGLQSWMCFVRLLFRGLKISLPLHPAVRLVENFLNHKLTPVNIKATDIITFQAAQYLADLRRMPEVKQVAFQIGLRRGKDVYIGYTEGCERHLAKDGIFQILYPFGFACDLWGWRAFDRDANPTRALLGSFNGRAEVIDLAEDFATVKFTVWNPLTWQSLTRFPPILGGYDPPKPGEAGMKAIKAMTMSTIKSLVPPFWLLFPKTGERSLVPDIPGWSVDMRFEWEDRVWVDRKEPPKNLALPDKTLVAPVPIQTIALPFKN